MNDEQETKNTQALNTDEGSTVNTETVGSSSVEGKETDEMPRKKKEEAAAPADKPKRTRKAKATQVAFEAEAPHEAAAPAEKPKRGRPKGSKNKPKVEAAAPTDKPKRGRPKGSTNKPKTEAAAAPADKPKRTRKPKDAAAAPADKPKRGRPKGSKNKSTTEAPAAAPEAAAPKKRGRKPGRKPAKAMNGAASNRVIFAVPAKAVYADVQVSLGADGKAVMEVKMVDAAGETIQSVKSA